MNTGNVLQKFWALSLVVLLAGFIGIGQANAQSTYYVDAVTGNDAFDGSQMAVGGFPAGPFKSITQAYATVSDGDTVVILANDYTGNAAFSIAKTVTLSVRTSGGNTIVLMDDITMNGAGKTLTFAQENGSSGSFTLSDGAGDALVLTAGTVNNSGSVTFASGATITRTNGTFTGNAPAMINLNVTYNDASGNVTAGNELPSNLGTGVLTLNVGAGDLLSIGGAREADNIDKTGPGNVTFSGAVTIDGGDADDLAVTAAGTLTFSSTLTVSGGITVGNNAAVLNAGATSVAGHPVALGGTGLSTFSSLDLTSEELNVTNTGGATVTGAVTFSNGARDVITNSSTGTVTLGSVTSQITDTAADDSGADHDIVNSSTGKITINGAITEGSITEAVDGAGANPEIATISIENTNAGGTFTIGANSTIRGDVNNADRTGAGTTTGIILANSATLTVGENNAPDGTDSPVNRTSFGDVIGGTLALAYQAGADDAVTTVAGNAKSVTKVNNLTFTSAVSGHTAAVNNDGAPDPTLATLSVGGDLRIEASGTFEIGLTVTGTVYIAANNVNIDAVGDDGAGPDVKDKATGVQGVWGGLSVGSSTGFSVGTDVNDALEDLTVSGTTAEPAGGVFGGDFIAAAAAVTTKSGFTSDAFQAASHTASTGVTTIGTGYDVAGAVVVSSGATLTVTSTANTDDAASLDIDGTFNYASTGLLTVSGDIDIDASTGSLVTAAAARFTSGGSFSGGTYTDTGSNDTWIFNVPAAGATISVKPGTTTNNMTINGSGRTATFTESITLSNGLTLGNDVTVALGANSFVLSGGNLTLNDEASITNSGTNGSVQFTAGANQQIDVAGAPTTDPTLQNVVVNITGNNDLIVDEAINVAGTITVLDGEITQASNVTFTGSAGELAYKVDSADGITGGPMNGVHDLEYLGTNATGGGEFTATNIRDLTINMTSGNKLTLPATEATITGNLLVKAGSTLETDETLTVNGNATFYGGFEGDAGESLKIAGILTVPDGIALDDDGGAGTTIQLTGAGTTHSVVGTLALGTTLKVSSTGITVNGSIAAGDANLDSEFDDITVDSGASVTFNTVQDINGDIDVSGEANITLVTDGAAGNDTDGQITGNVTVRGGGSLTLASNDGSASAIGGTVAVHDNATMTLGSNLGATGDVTIGGGVANATPATFDLNGKTFIANGGALAVTATASSAATAPSFGTSGTLNITAGEIVGSTNPTIPNLTINSAGAIDSDVTVTGTFTVLAASSGENGDNVTLRGTGQFNASYTATAGDAGSYIITSPASINSTVNGAVEITNLKVAGNTTMAYNGNVNGGATNFQVAFLNHDSGVLDITDETFTFVGDGGAADEWDYDGGSYSGTGTYVVAGTAQEIDMSTNGATVSVPNLTIRGAAGQGLELDAAGDGISVTGTLTLAAQRVANTAVSNGGAAVNTIQLNAAQNQVDDFYNGGIITITSGAGAGQSREITDYDAAGGATNDLITVSPNWTTAVDNTSVYRIDLPAISAANVQTEVGGTDATFSVANGATIVRETRGAIDHFDNAPTLGTGLTVRYTNNAADVTTANELPGALARLEWENTTGDNLFLEDGVALTVDQLEMAGNISIDENDDGDNSITISDGGRIEYDGAFASFTDQGAAADSEAPSFAGSAELRFLAGFGATATTDLTWPDALAPTVVVGSTGANVDVQMHESRSVAALTVGDGNAANTSQVTLGATTMTVSGTTAIAADGTVTGGTLDANGMVTNSGSLASAVLASQSITLTGNLTTLTLDGTTAQTLTVPAAGASLTTLVVNNAAGVTVAGGNVAVGTQTVAGGASGAVTGGLTLTAGGLNMGGNTLLLAHAGSGIQGYTRTNGCVYGNIRKQLSNTTNTAPADRLEFPLCSAGGTYRPYAITFNNPNVIGGAAPTNGSPTASVAPALTVKHDVSGENGVSALSGTNGLPQTVNGIAVARYPISPSFFWTVSPSFTMSPSLTYDVDMRANDYSDFSASCGDAACDINEIYPIRRHVGSSSNLWSVASATTDNFLAGDNDPVVIGRSATGALQTSGTVFTFGLKSIFAAAAGSQSYATTTGNSHIVDLSTLFSGAAGSVTYSAVASDATGVTNPTTANIAGNNLTITGGADAGSATVTVNATDAFGATASATFSVTNSAALAATSDDLDRAMNVGGTSAVAFADAFSGGAGTVTYGAASSDASVTVAIADGVVTMTGASAGSATVTLTATDASSTAVSATKAIAVTVNAGVSVANAVADMSIVQGQTATVDASTVFANGTGAIAVTVSGGTAVVGATIDGTTVTVSGLKAYDGDPLADSAPVTITLTGTDTLGGTTTDSFDVTVTPVLGDLDGSGAPSAASASLALDAALGLVNLTANQLAAVDYNGDSNVTAYDAALIFAAAANAKVDFVANPAAELVFGDLSFEGNIISIPVQVSGDVNDVISASFATRIDPALATIVGVTSELADGWMVRSVIAEDGTINLAVAGLGTIDSEGIIATINVQLTGSNVQFNLDAEGAVNNNATMALDAVEVAELPETFALHGNYPNPFNPTTSIAFDLPESADVEIQVIDMIGRQVMTLPATQIAAGVNRTVQIDAARLASGTYFYRVIAKMESKTLVETGRMMLVK